MSSAIIRATAPLTWRGTSRAAKKLASFSATELGSALDMFRAADLVDDDELRTLFLRHAFDELRHAEIFRSAARSRGGCTAPYLRQHATRDDLFTKLGLVRFIAFVHLAERRGEAHFSELASHFRDDELLRPLFDSIAKDERFHISYTGRILQKWRRQRGRFVVARALTEIRLRGVWMAGRRTGRRVAELIAGALLDLIYFVALPPFALIERFSRSRDSGWCTADRIENTEEARRQF